LSHAQVQHGLAALRFEQRHGKTCMTSVRTRSPLAVQRALYLEETRPHLAHIILANPSAGILAGDRHVIDLGVGSGACARVTTQAATKVFSMPDGYAEQRLRMSVEPGGWLEYLAHPMIPFRSACLSQYVEIDIAEGGTVAYGDILSLGRVEAGERLAFQSLTMDLRVRRPTGQDLYVESYQLKSGDRALDLPGVLGQESTAALGTLIIVTDRVTPDELCDALLVGTSAAHGPSSIGLGPLPGGGGVVLKAIAASASEAESSLQRATAQWLSSFN
jgi:urease accessory protein